VRVVHGAPDDVVPDRDQAWPFPRHQLASGHPSDAVLFGQQVPRLVGGRSGQHVVAGTGLTELNAGRDVPQETVDLYAEMAFQEVQANRCRNGDAQALDCQEIRRRDSVPGIGPRAAAAERVEPRPRVERGRSGAAVLKYVRRASTD
jgi:hypothetical protein